jgi:hypothetical protein
MKANKNIVVAESDPEDSFQNVPRIGPAFARLIHEHLHIDTLEALEAAAHDGRLDTVPGIGERRGKAIRRSLARILAREAPLASSVHKVPPPPIIHKPGENRRLV